LNETRQGPADPKGSRRALSFSARECPACTIAPCHGAPPGRV